MPVAHFSRVVDDTEWRSLTKTTQAQKAQGCKPLNYEAVAEIYLSASDFNRLTSEIAWPDLCYLQYTNQSVANGKGIWNCILISNIADGKKIALYTAGRTFPLYAAVIEGI